MKINYQTNDNDCGICVLKSIYEFSFKKEISNEDICKNFCLDKKGISIYDFEILGRNINLNIESYKIEFKEFEKLKYKDFFITSINSEYGNHFVICKRNKNKIIIYDSAKGKYELLLNDFEKIYSGYFIVFSKSTKHKDTQYNNSNIFDTNNEWLFILSLFLLNVLLISISLIGSSILKIIFSFIEKNNYYEFIFLILYFFMIFLMEYLLIYFLEIFKTKKMDELTKRNAIYYINFLSKKRYIFFKLNSREYLYQQPVNIANIITYKYVKCPELYSDFVFLLLAIIMMALKSEIILVFAIIYITINIIFSFLIKKYNENNYKKNYQYKNESEYKLHKIYNFLENEKNQDKFTNLSSSIKESMWKMFNQNKVNNSYFSKISFIKNILIKIIFLIILTYFVNLIMLDKENPSEMIFFITLISLIDHYSNNLFENLSFIPIYKKSLCEVNKFLSDYNKKENAENKIRLTSINSIQMLNVDFGYGENNNIFSEVNLQLKNNTLIHGVSGIGKTTFLRILSLDNEINKGQILINGIDSSLYDLNHLDSIIYYIPNNCSYVHIDYSVIIDLNQHLHKEIADFLKITKISMKKENELSKGEIQLLNLFSLLKYRNSIILLDETFSNISNDYIDMFMNYFFSTISKHNFVVCVSHSEYLKKYFKNHLEVNNEWKNKN